VLNVYIGEGCVLEGLAWVRLGSAKEALVAEKQGCPSLVHELNSPKQATDPRTKCPSHPRCLGLSPNHLVSRTTTRVQRPNEQQTSKIMIPQNFNVCSCHSTFCAKCIYKGDMGLEQPHCPTKGTEGTRDERFQAYGSTRCVSPSHVA